MATPAPTALDVTDLKFKLQNKVPVFAGDGTVRDGCCLLAAASVHGLVFVGTTGPQLRVLQLSSITPDKVIDEVVPLRTVALPSEPYQLAVSCDHGLLAVDVVVGGVPFVYVYSVPSFLTPTVGKLYEIRTSPEGGVRSTQILWNPVIHNMFSLRTENGALSVYTLKEGSGFEFHSLDKAEGAICACWSPKGKQLVVGFANGKLAQYKPDLKLARTIVCPGGVMEGAFDVIAVQWLSTYQFAAVFMPKSDDSVPSLFIVNAPKVGNPVYINYEDICYSQSGPRKGQVFLVHILPWNLLLMASANSMEVGILGTTETGETPTWCQWSTTDEARAELPLSADKQETFPAGLALDTGCKHQVLVGEETIPVMPMLHMVSTYGLLVSFNILNLTPNVPNICSPPRPVNDTSGQFERLDFSKPVTAPAPQVAAAAPPQAAEISFALPTGATSTPAIAKTKSFFSPSENKSSMNLFGASTATTTTAPAATITPTFGKPLTFGGFAAATPPTTTSEPVKTSPFGGTPSFGSIGGFAPPAQQQQPVAAQSSLLKQTLAQPPKQAPEPTKPFVTVPPTYTPPAPTPAADLARSGSSGSLAQQKQKQKPVEPSEDTNFVIRSMITEEIRKFEKELTNLQSRCQSQSIAIGTKEESAGMIRDLKELQDLSVQARESTESLTSDVQALRLGLNEAFAMVAEANSKDGIFKHPSPNMFQETHAMSQSSRRQLASLQNNLAINENQLQIVNKQLDAQWSAIQEASRVNSRRRMHVPSLEVLYQTLSKQQEILNRQRDKISGLKGKLGLRENIRGLEKNRRMADLSGDNGTTAAIDSLTDSIVAMNIGEKIRADAQRMTDAKMDALRRTLRQRKIVTVKAGRPDRVGLNSEVVRERRNEARRQNQEKPKQQAPKPVQQPQQQPKPVAVKAPEAAPKFELPKSAMPSFAPKPAPAAVAAAAPVAKPATSGAFSFAAPSATAAAAAAAPAPVPTSKPVFSFGPSSAATTSPFGQPAKPKEPEIPKETTLFGSTTIKPIQATVAPQKPKEKSDSTAPPPAYGFGTSGLTIQAIPKPKDTAEPPKATVLAFGSNNNGGAAAPKPTFAFGAANKEPVSFGVPQPPATTPALNLTKEKENEPGVKPLADKPKKDADPLPAAADPEPAKSAFPALTNLLQKVDPAKPEATPATTKPPTLFGSVAKTTSSIFGTSSTATIAPGTGLFGSIKPVTSTAAGGGLFAGVSFGSGTAPTTTTSVESGSTNVTTTSSALFGSIKPAATTTTTTTSSGFSFGFGSATAATSAKPTDLSVKADAVKAESKEEVKTPPAATSTTSTVPPVSSTAVSTTAATPAPSATPASTTTTTDTTSNLFGSFNICSPSTPPETSKPASSSNIFGTAAFSTPKTDTTSIFGGASAEAKPDSAFGSVNPAATPATGLFGAVTSSSAAAPGAGSSIFGGGSPFGTPASTAPATAGSGLFGSITPATSPVATGASAGSILGGGATASPFGAAAASATPAASVGIFGGAASAAPSSGGLFGSVGASPAAATGAATGGSIFGGSSAFGASANTSSGNIFGSATTGSTGGFGSSAFGQPASPAPAQSIFGGGASTPAFGGSSFGSPAPTGGAFSQPTGSVATSGFGSPTASAFNKPAAFGGAHTFGGTPAFGAAPAFGSKPTFGSPPAVASAFGQPAANPTSPSNNLFEQLGSSSQGVSFGNLAQQSAQKPAQFGGSSFSSWR
ncbi:nuclear pore complex protein Nup214 [Culex pipiens pallens]|uniref:nuclear pore complex protein Nup214 n=1 Tax=Culex pipiens pallens TaxID=42434 RepID=UPI0019549BBF|nr:nuclear pore complex protein Nup214 [Culex pipiens pallens]